MQTFVPHPGAGGQPAVLPHAAYTPGTPAVLQAGSAVDYAAFATTNASVQARITLEDGTYAEVGVVVPFGSDEVGLLAAINETARDFASGSFFGEPLDYTRFGFEAEVIVFMGIPRLTLRSRGTLLLRQTPDIASLGFTVPAEGLTAAGIPERVQDTLARHVFDNDGVSVERRLAPLRASETQAAQPYYVYADARVSSPAQGLTVEFLVEGQPRSAVLSAGASPADIALQLNTAIFATVVTATSGGNLVFQGTHTLDFRGTSAAALAVLGLSPEQTLMAVVPGDALVSTDGIEDRSQGAAIGSRLTRTIQYLRDGLDTLGFNVGSLIEGSEAQGLFLESGDPDDAIGRNGATWVKLDGSVYSKIGGNWFFQGTLPGMYAPTPGGNGPTGPAVPAPTPDDAGKIVRVNGAGSAYELAAPNVLPSWLAEADVALNPAATEAAIRAAIDEACGIVVRPNRKAIMNWPGQRVTFAETLLLSGIDGRRVYIRGATATRKAVTGILSITSTGAGTNQWDVRIGVDDSSPWAVGDECWLQYMGMVGGTAVGASLRWTPLIGTWPVVAVNAVTSNTLTLRVTSRVDLSTTPATSLTFSGAAYVQIAAVRQTSGLYQPNAVGAAIRLSDSRLNLARLNVIGPAGNGASGGPQGIHVDGLDSMLKLGALAIRGFDNHLLRLGDGSSVMLSHFGLPHGDGFDGSEFQCLTANGGGNYGVLVQPGCRISSGQQAPVAHSFCGNNNAGIGNEGGEVQAYGLKGMVAGGNLTFGIVTFRGNTSRVYAPDFTIKDNVSSGIYSIEGAVTNEVGSHSSITRSPAAGTVGNTNALNIG